MSERVREWLLTAAMLGASLFLLLIYARRGQWTFTLEFVRAWLSAC